MGELANQIVCAGVTAFRKNEKWAPPGADEDLSPALKETFLNQTSGRQRFNTVIPNYENYETQRHESTLSDKLSASATRPKVNLMFFF